MMKRLLFFALLLVSLTVTAGDKNFHIYCG